jgi:predicted RNA binding protein YcfA (HicA-like mRNA interferase family)
MKRRSLIRHLERQGCELLREGRNHSVYVNRHGGKTSTVPRHREINDFLGRKICRDLAIPEPPRDKASH